MNWVIDLIERYELAEKRRKDEKEKADQELRLATIEFIRKYFGFDIPMTLETLEDYSEYVVIGQLPSGAKIYARYFGGSVVRNPKLTLRMADSRSYSPTVECPYDTNEAALKEFGRILHNWRENEQLGDEAGDSGQAAEGEERSQLPGHPQPNP